jgi:non-canonical purine NTP pyrophosphatase (RdgB/HAM1 family)
MIEFITGNNGKFNEAVRMLDPLKVRLLNIDLDEVQSLDAKKVLRHKLGQALKYRKGNFFVEDTCVYFKGLKNKLPGPLAKWFWEALEPVGVYEMVKGLSTDHAEMHSTIGFVENKNKIAFFSSKIVGRIVKPKGTYGFGFDIIFQPENTNKTLSELKGEGKFEYSPRCGAMAKLKKYLMKNN